MVANNPENKKNIYNPEVEIGFNWAQILWTIFRTTTPMTFLLKWFPLTLAPLFITNGNLVELLGLRTPLEPHATQKP